ncbi:hypothetical protein QCA50_002325 [Cerrena zonata]|uniref:T6SS Phospholipase effector Tle1-like catalytic domain-containing protein n=1 Tax=Cerrena zonata TaxID=2478898 RepID=A0AAW0GV52_9APHY
MSIERSSRPTFTIGPTNKEAVLGTHPGDMPKSTIAATATATGVDVPHNGKSTVKKRNEKRRLEREFSERDGHTEETDVKEVWFAGCHCDVGGGSVPNDTRHNLARIPLRWMIRECFRMDTGIRFHSSVLKSVGLDPASLYPKVLDRPEAIFTIPPTIADPTHARESTTDTTQTLVDGSAIDSQLTEEEEDLLDALSPVYDQLSLAPGWWILELLPMRFKKQHSDNSWVSDWGCNLGRPRKVPNRIQKRGQFFVHRSVKMRMEAEASLLPGGVKYAPKAQWKIDPIWVD